MPDASRENLTAELRQSALRLRAAIAEGLGIDTTRAGWGDELAARQRQRDRRIATPYIAEAIDQLEAQFEGAADA